MKDPGSPLVGKSPRKGQSTSPTLLIDKHRSSKRSVHTYGYFRNTLSPVLKRRRKTENVSSNINCTETTKNDKSVEKKDNLFPQPQLIITPENINTIDCVPKENQMKAVGAPKISLKKGIKNLAKGRAEKHCAQSQNTSNSEDSNEKAQKAKATDEKIQNKIYSNKNSHHVACTDKTLQKRVLQNKKINNRGKKKCKVSQKDNLLNASPIFPKQEQSDLLITDIRKATESEHSSQILQKEITSATVEMHEGRNDRIRAEGPNTILSENTFCSSSESSCSEEKCDLEVSSYYQTPIGDKILWDNATNTLSDIDISMTIRENNFEVSDDILPATLPHETTPNAKLAEQALAVLNHDKNNSCKLIFDVGNDHLKLDDQQENKVLKKPELHQVRQSCIQADEHSVSTEYFEDNMHYRNESNNNFSIKSCGIGAKTVTHSYKREYTALKKTKTKKHRHSNDIMLSELPQNKQSCIQANGLSVSTKNIKSNSHYGNKSNFALNVISSGVTAKFEPDSNKHASKPLKKTKTKKHKGYNDCKRSDLHENKQRCILADDHLVSTGNIVTNIRHSADSSSVRHVLSESETPRHSISKKQFSSTSFVENICPGENEFQNVKCKDYGISDINISILKSEMSSFGDTELSLSTKPTDCNRIFDFPICPDLMDNTCKNSHIQANVDSIKVNDKFLKKDNESGFSVKNITKQINNNSLSPVVLNGIKDTIVSKDKILIEKDDDMLNKLIPVSSKDLNTGDLKSMNVSEIEKGSFLESFSHIIQDNPCTSNEAEPAGTHTTENDSLEQKSTIVDDGLLSLDETFTDDTYSSDSGSWEDFKRHTFSEISTNEMNVLKKSPKKYISKLKASSIKSGSSQKILRDSEMMQNKKSLNLLSYKEQNTPENMSSFSDENLNINFSFEEADINRNTESESLVHKKNTRSDVDVPILVSNPSKKKLCIKNDSKTSNLKSIDSHMSYKSGILMLKDKCSLNDINKIFLKPNSSPSQEPYSVVSFTKTKGNAMCYSPELACANISFDNANGEKSLLDQSQIDTHSNSGITRSTVSSNEKCVIDDNGMFLKKDIPSVKVDSKSKKGQVCNKKEVMCKRLQLKMKRMKEYRQRIYLSHSTNDKTDSMSSNKTCFNKIISSTPKKPPENSSLESVKLVEKNTDLPKPVEKDASVTSENLKCDPLILTTWLKEESDNMCQQLLLAAEPNEADTGVENAHFDSPVGLLLNNLGWEINEEYIFSDEENPLSGIYKKNEEILSMTLPSKLEFENLKTTDSKKINQSFVNVESTNDDMKNSEDMEKVITDIVNSESLQEAEMHFSQHKKEPLNGKQQIVHESRLEPSCNNTEISSKKAEQNNQDQNHNKIAETETSEDVNPGFNELTETKALEDMDYEEFFKRHLDAYCMSKIMKNVCLHSDCSKIHRVDSKLFDALQMNEVKLIVRTVFKKSERLSMSFISELIRFFGRHAAKLPILSLSKRYLTKEFINKKPDYDYFQKVSFNFFSALQDCDIKRPFAELIKYNITFFESISFETIQNILECWLLSTDKIHAFWPIVEPLTSINGFLLQDIILLKSIQEVIESPKVQSWVSFSNQLLLLPQDKFLRFPLEDIKVLLRNLLSARETDLVKILNRKIHVFYKTEDMSPRPKSIRSVSPLSQIGSEKPKIEPKRYSVSPSNYLLRNAQNAVKLAVKSQNFHQLALVVTSPAHKNIVRNVLGFVFDCFNAEDPLIMTELFIKEFSRYQQKSHLLCGSLIFSFIVYFARGGLWEVSYGFFNLFNKFQINKYKIQDISENISPIQRNMLYSEVLYHNIQHKESIQEICKGNILVQIARGEIQGDSSFIELLKFYLWDNLTFKRTENALLLFNYVLDSQQSCFPIDLSIYFDSLAKLLFEASPLSETPLKFYAYLCQIASVPLCGLTIRVLVILAYRFKQWSLLENLFQKGLESGCYPCIEGNMYTISLVKSFSDEEMTCYIVEWLLNFKKRVHQGSRVVPNTEENTKTESHHITICFKGELLKDYHDSPCSDIPSMLKEVDESLGGSMSRLTRVLRSLNINSSFVKNDSIHIDFTSLINFLR